MGKTIAIFFVFLFSLMILPVGEGRATDGFSVVVVSIVRNAAGLCDKAFDPPVIKISSGTTVVWANKDIVTHTLVSAEGEDPCGPTLLPIGERAIDGGIGNDINGGLPLFT